ncbi:MAG: pilus assembly protein TadG-related protein, partial [Pseudomonadota bacterium]
CSGRRCVGIAFAISPNTKLQVVQGDAVMFAKTAKVAKSFQDDTCGAVMMIFGLSILGFALVAGLAVDYGRISHIKSRLLEASDAAALAAGKALLDGRLNNSEIELLAVRNFNANILEGGNVLEVVNTPDISVDRATGSVNINVSADVEMTLMKLAGFTSVTVPAGSATRFDQRDVELAMALDLTGSMNNNGKLGDLKVATKDLIDILLPDGGTPNEVHIAFAPYSSGVNAGRFAEAATGVNANTFNGCTFEREGFDEAEFQAPGPGDYLKTNLHPDVRNGISCPTSAPVVPLSDNKAQLKSTVDAYQASGTTAGHTGTQWASYLLSPEWNGVLDGHDASAFGDGSTVKAMVLMTDGAFNTFGGFTNGTGADRSYERTAELCQNLRDELVMVFTVGFGLGNTGRPVDALRDCAGDESRFFNAENGDELRAAFQNIAQQLNNLRLTN